MFISPNLSLKEKPRLFVLLKESIYHLVKLEIVAPFLGTVVSLNRSKLIKSGLPVTFKCLYNAASLSRFTFSFNCKLDVASAVAGSVNDVSSTLLVVGVP